MRPDFAFGFLRRLPLAWTATVRARRLLFIAALAPGVSLAGVAAPLGRQPLLLALGGGLILTAVVLRRLSEPRFLATQPSSPVLSSEPSS